MIAPAPPLGKKHGALALGDERVRKFGSAPVDKELI